MNTGNGDRVRHSARGRCAGWALLAALASLAAVSAHAGDKEKPAPEVVPLERIAVLEFSNKADLPMDDGMYLAEQARGAVLKALSGRGYLVMTKENILDLLADTGITFDEACEGSCEVVVGRKIGARYIVTGTIWKMGSSLEVIVKLFETKRGSLLAQETVAGAGLEALRGPLQTAVGGMMSVLGGAAAGGSGTTGRVAAPGSAPVFFKSSERPTGPSEGSISEVKPTQVDKKATGPAGLFITTDPPGAEVFLGSVRAGTTQPAFQASDLKPGTTQQVTLKKAEYHPETFNVELVPGFTRYNLKLDPAFGSLAIDSDPPGADVVIGGTKVGSTPYQRDRMPSGRYLVTVEKALYRPAMNQSIEVVDGKPTREKYELSPAFGALVVKSDPAGARVLLGNEEIGVTPYRNDQMASGQYLLSIERERVRACPRRACLCPAQ